jgi:hypothetical protein
MAIFTDHPPVIRPRIETALLPAVTRGGAALFQQLGAPGGATAGTGPVFNQAFEDFQRIQAQGGVLLRSLITPQQRFNEALAILRQSVAFGALTADERTAAEKRLSEAMGVTTRRSAVLGVAIVGAVSGAIAAVMQGGSAGGIIGGILGTVGGIVGIANPLLGAGIGGLGQIISAAGNRGVRIDEYSERALSQQRQLNPGPDRVTLQIFSQSTGELLDEIEYELGRRTRLDRIIRIPRGVRLGR